MKEYAEHARRAAAQQQSRRTANLQEWMTAELSELSDEFAKILKAEGIAPYSLGYLQRGRQQPRWEELGTGWFVGNVNLDYEQIEGLGVLTTGQPVRVADETFEDYGRRYSKPDGWTGLTAVGVRTHSSLELFEFTWEPVVASEEHFFQQWRQALERTFGEAIYRLRERAEHG